MQILITHGGLARSRVLRFTRLQLGLAAALLVAALLLLSGAIYHFVFLKAAREGWPVVSQLVRLVVRDEIAQREQLMQLNLDAMARKVGQMQARMIELEAVGERVGGLAGVKPEELRPARADAASAPRAGMGGQGGAGAGEGGPYLPLPHPSMDQLQATLDGLEQWADRHGDLLTLAESRLMESRLARLMVPSSAPVDGPSTSGFGVRADPFTGRPALHTGLDFPADPGTPILAAAGGVVVSAETHPQYGQLLEIDHGNRLTTRYAHCQRFLVKPGDIVRRGQPVAEVGTTGRSTGPHLHFEVLLGGVLQNPSRFLAQRPPAPTQFAARAGG